MRNKQIIWLLGVLAPSVLTSFIIDVSVQKNNPPVVKIISPENNSTISRNTMIPYTISVSDKEDGESKYKEIPDTEVFLEVKYFPDAAKASIYLKKGIQKDPIGFVAIKKSDCFNCHNMKSKLIGPSFEEISKRYKPTALSLANLAGHIKNGSTGVWGTSNMPSHPELSVSESKNAAEWIIKYGGDPTINYYRGTEGSFWCKPETITSSGVYVLTSSYNDHGSNGNFNESHKGQDVVTLKIKK